MAPLFLYPNGRVHFQLQIKISLICPMFNWFKRKKDGLDNWSFEGIEDFKMIRNSDSIQYVNSDSTRFIYFSVLTVSGGNVFPIDSYIDKQTVIQNGHRWDLKGAKNINNQILICVISVTRQDDIEWAKMFFDSIKPV